MKQVIRQEFFKFLERYPKEIDRDECNVTGLVAYSDRSIGGYPKCIVAKYEKVKDQSKIKYFIKE
jgi:hypothetical protein